MRAGDARRDRAILGCSISMIAGKSSDGSAALLRALRRTVAADSDPNRALLFEAFRRSSTAARLVTWLYARLGRGRASTLLVATYGLRSLIATRVRANSGARLLTVAVHANARTQVLRVARWFPTHDTEPVLFDLRGSLTTRGFRRGAPLALGRHRITRTLGILSRLNKRHDFLVVCRAASTIATYAVAHRLLSRRSVGAVVVSSDTNPEEIAFAAAARRRGVATVFIAHAQPGPNTPALDFSLALLEGESALRSRRERGAITGDVFLLGLEGKSRPLDPRKLGARRPRVGVFLPKVVDWDRLRGVIEQCQRRFAPSRMLIRWHPSMLGASNASVMLREFPNLVETARDARLDDIATECDWVITDANSNVVIPVLKLGIPTVTVRRLGVAPVSLADQYGFVANGLVPAPVQEIDDLDIALAQQFYGGDWAERFASVDSAYLGDSTAREDVARARIDALLGQRTMGTS